MYTKILLALLLTTSLHAKGKSKSVKGTTIVNGMKVVKKLINSSKTPKTNARKVVKNKIPKNQSGIYNFQASNQKNYTGQAGKGKQGVRERLMQHLNSGKLAPKDVKTVKWAKINKADLNKIESKEIKIRDFTSKGNSANKQHAPMSRVKQKTEKALSDLNKEVTSKKDLLKMSF